MYIAHGIHYVGRVCLIDLHASRLRIYRTVVAEYRGYQLIDRAKQGWQENATGSRNRTEATSLLEKVHALGSQAASLESDRVKNLDKILSWLPRWPRKERGFVMS
jgi:hypothetical protein